MEEERWPDRGRNGSEVSVRMELLLPAWPGCGAVT